MTLADLQAMVGKYLRPPASGYAYEHPGTFEVHVLIFSAAKQPPASVDALMSAIAAKKPAHAEIHLHFALESDTDVDTVFRLAGVAAAIEYLKGRRSGEPGVVTSGGS